METGVIITISVLGVCFIIALLLAFRKSYRVQTKNNYEEIRDESIKEKLNIYDEIEKENDCTINEGVTSALGVMLQLMVVGGIGIVTLMLIGTVGSDVFYETTGMNTTNNMMYGGAFATIDMAMGLLPLVGIGFAVMIVLGVVLSLVEVETKPKKKSYRNKTKNNYEKIRDESIKEKLNIRKKKRGVEELGDDEEFAEDEEFE